MNSPSGPRPSLVGGSILDARQRFLHADPYAAYRRMIRGTATLLLLLAFGVVGYMVIESWSFSDAVYMTVITITTVGYEEVKPLSETGRIFTVFVILFGVGTVLYILTILVQTVVEGELAAAFGVRRMQAKIDALKDHIILCGFGRVGQEVAAELLHRDVPLVIIDPSHEAIERALLGDQLVVEGDAADDDVLKRAGIGRARALLAASDEDAVNTYITLAAKALRPDLHIITRIGQPGSESRALRAGANRVISPYEITGRRMALSAIQPLTGDFLDLLSSERGGRPILAEIDVTETSDILGMETHDVMHRTTGSALLAIRHESGEVQVGPPDDYRLRTGDRLMLLSNDEDLEVLAQESDGPTSAGAPGGD